MAAPSNALEENPHGRRNTTATVRRARAFPSLRSMSRIFPSKIRAHRVRCRPATRHRRSTSTSTSTPIRCPRTDFDVVLSLNAEAKDGDKRSVPRRARLWRRVPGRRLPAGAHAAGSLHRVPAPAVPVRAPDHRRRHPQRRLPAADDRPDRFRADVRAARCRRTGPRQVSATFN